MKAIEKVLAIKIWLVVLKWVETNTHVQDFLAFFMEKFIVKDQQTKDKFVEMRAKGISYDRIAKELNVHRQTLIAWSKNLKNEIANLKSIELDGLYEKYFLTKQKRIELYGEKLKEIKAELHKRKLSDLKTSELFNLLVKYDAILQKEKTETTFQEEKDTFFGESKTQTWEA